VGGPAVILVVGDVMDDLIVRPLRPFAPRTDTPARMEHQPGGSGANTAAWLGALGAPVRFAGRVGQADVRRHGAALAAFGVDARLSGDAQAPTGRIVVLAHDRSMFTDRGANVRLGAGDLGDDLLEGVAHVHVSGYALVDAGPRAAVLALVARAGVPWSVDPASAGYLSSGAPEAFLDWTAGATVCFPNEDEADVLGDGLADAYEVVVLKGSDRVRVLRDGALSAELAAAPAVLVDPTGAGDAFAAGYLAAMVRGEDDAGCVAGGVAAAARAVGLTGARPR
jgi:sugar/nucleoside kinase (ribokinase family)